MFISDPEGATHDDRKKRRLLFAASTKVVLTVRGNERGTNGQVQAQQSTTARHAHSSWVDGGNVSLFGVVMHFVFFADKMAGGVRRVTALRVCASNEKGT